jgi:hypothetical protein
MEALIFENFFHCMEFPPGPPPILLGMFFKQQYSEAILEHSLQSLAHGVRVSCHTEH